MTTPNSTFSALVLSFLFSALPACTGLHILSPKSGVVAGDSRMLSAVYMRNLGPSEFSINASAIGAPLVDMGHAWAQLCEPLDENDALRSLIIGKIVLVSKEGYVEECDPEDSYLNIVNAGARGIVLFLTGEMRPGMYLSL